MESHVSAVPGAPVDVIVDDATVMKGKCLVVGSQIAVMRVIGFCVDTGNETLEYVTSV